MKVVPRLKAIALNTGGIKKRLITGINHRVIWKGVRECDKVGYPRG